LVLMAVAGVAAIGFAAFGDWPAWLGRTGAVPMPPSPALVAAADPPLAASPAAAASSMAAEPTSPSAAVPALALAPSTTLSRAPSPATPRRANGATAEQTVKSPTTPGVTPGVTPVVTRIVAPATAPPAQTATIVSTDSAGSANAPAAIDKRAVALKPTQRATLLLRQAHESAQAGQPRAALALAREALTIDPSLAGARLLAAVLEHETGASERAAQLLRDGLAREPRDGAQALLLARVQVAQGDGPGALATLEQHALHGAEADGLRGGILTQQGDHLGALKAYEAAARQQPANPMWWLGLGIALDGGGDAPRARQAYARALAIGLPRDDLTQFADRRLRGND
jgi:predicted negative regulator of RcsB-dependent stress response